jgi:hypothetical protein
MRLPWVPVEPLPGEVFAQIRRRAIFECCKWDPQIGDACSIARHPLVLTQAAWTEVSGLAEALARETMAAETELVLRPALHRALGLPWSVRRALARAARIGPSRGTARLIRFDFHFTTEGWRISEANADVPGGLNEASGFPRLVAPHYTRTTSVGDPASAYSSALATRVDGRGTVALLHATAFSDDQQMMQFVARHLRAGGLTAHLASPSHVRWHDGRASLDADWWKGPLDLVIRFFPGDWLAGLPHSTGWPHFFAGARTPLSNPATAILTQTKRFPLVWEALTTPLPTWRALLPETRPPGDAPWRTSDDWVLKPALGRVGEGIGLKGVVELEEWRRIQREARWWPNAWVAQRRFETLPADIGGTRVFPCLGVYTLDGRVIGAYGRVARRPLIDARASDAAVLAA